MASASNRAKKFVYHAYQNDFMKCMNKQRRNAQYTDVTLQSGDVHIPCHRAVLAVATSASNTAEEFVDTAYQNDFMKCMNKQRRNAQYTDVTLQSGDVHIPCHRAVLAVASEYFNTMFTCGLEETTSAVVKLTMEPDILSSIVEYVYTGKIKLTVENVESLIKVCDLVQLNILKAACDKFMLKHVEPANCVGFCQFAKLYRVNELQQKARQVMLAQFKSVACNTEFKELSLDELIGLIKDDAVVVESEDMICEAVLDWVQHDLDNRKSCLETILEHVRLPYCKGNYLWHTKATCDLLTPKCLEYIDEAFKFQVDRVHQHEISSCRTVPRANFQMKSCLLMFATQTINCVTRSNHYNRYNQVTRNKTNNCCYYYREDTKCWVQLMNLSTQLEDSNFSLCGTDKGHLLREGKIGWLLHLATTKVETMPELASVRHRDGSVSLGDCVYVVGGNDIYSKMLKSVECLNLRERRWSSVPDMPQAVLDPLVVTCNNKVYVLGGLMQGDAACCTQVFDTTWGKWSTRSAMPEACSGCAAVVLNNSIYVVGGNNRTCLRYDPASDSWTKLSPPCKPHALAVAVVWHGCILVATRGSALSTEVCEQYSPTTDKWFDWSASFNMQENTTMVCHSLFNVDLYDLR